MNIKLIAKISLITILIATYGSGSNFSTTSSKRVALQLTITKTVRNNKTYSHDGSIIEVWDRLRNNFCLNLVKDNKYVQFHSRKYKKQNQYLQQISNNASLYLPHIVEQLEQRKMPGELALLPIIESSFNPHATSNMGAVGIWQLTRTISKRYGLAKNNRYDDRKDLVAATNAALGYLEYLHEEFNGDWFLALAAYNAGEGRVKRAINKNLAQNKPTDFWSLSLPNETKNFVPKLLGLANLIKKADLDLPLSYK
jgi:membrane-bound lytic murein transglycosylase D